jgi:hypothetical protein
MVTIGCSSALHAAIGPRTAGRALPTTDGQGRLGDWAAILAERTFVVAIEERTCLTLVFRLRPIAGLRNRFAEALRRALAECGVPPGAIEGECAALRAASFVRRRHAALVGALEFAGEEALSHLDLGQDEASAQDMLNEYPYEECPAPCPKEAVGQLFGGRKSADRRRSNDGKSPRGLA